MKRRLFGTLTAVVLGIMLVLASCGANSDAETKGSASDADAQYKVMLTHAQLQKLSSSKFLLGVENYSFLKGTDVDLNDLVAYDKTIVKELIIDDETDSSTPGTYKVIYKMTLDASKLAQYEKEKNISFGLDSDSTDYHASAVCTNTVLDQGEKAPDSSVLLTSETIKQLSAKNSEAVANTSKVSKASETTKEKETTKKEKETEPTTAAPEVTNTNNTEPVNNADAAPQEDYAPEEQETEHVHNWVPQTTVVHHDAEGHWEIGSWEETLEDGTVVLHDSEPVWVVDDSTGWDEVVETGTYICSECGAVR